LLLLLILLPLRVFLLLLLLLLLLITKVSKRLSRMPMKRFIILIDFHLAA
jgi:hypothetical protein